MQSLEQASHRVRVSKFELVCALVLLGAAAFALWPIAVPEAVLGTAELAPTQPANPEPSLLPFPDAAFTASLWTPPLAMASAQEPAPAAKPPRTNYTLVAINTDGADRVAIFHDPSTGRLIKLRPGDSVESLAVTSITEYEVALRINDRPSTISLRRPSP